MVPFVDQTEGAPICVDADAASKANEIHHNIFKVLGLYEREDVPPPCEYFIPTIKETITWRPQTDNYTVMASLEFSTQVHKKRFIYVCFFILGQDHRTDSQVLLAELPCRGGRSVI